MKKLVAFLVRLAYERLADVPPKQESVTEEQPPNLLRPDNSNASIADWY